MRSEAIRQDPTRKGSVVNVNPTNTRPQSDTPEIRKYKKRFNSEILCAALWGNAVLFLPCLLQFWSADLPVWAYRPWECISETLAVSLHLFNACSPLFVAGAAYYYVFHSMLLLLWCNFLLLDICFWWHNLDFIQLIMMSFSALSNPS